MVAFINGGFVRWIEFFVKYSLSVDFWHLAGTKFALFQNIIGMINHFDTVNDLALPINFGAVGGASSSLILKWDLGTYIAIRNS